jgi:hypothetical protein
LAWDATSLCLGGSPLRAPGGEPSAGFSRFIWNGLHRKDFEMARKNADWTPEVDEKPADAPKNRDQLVQEHRQRSVDEPAAAPRETDAEAAGESGETEDRPIPRKEPVKTYAVNTGEATREVKAGPGDAGSAESPRTTPEPARVPRNSGSRMLMIAGLVIVALLFIVLVGLP